MEIRNIYLVLLLQIKAFTQHLLFKYTMVGNWKGMIRRQNKDGSIIMKHESAALIGLFHAASSVLPPLEIYQNYREPTQRGVQGYLSSLQRRVGFLQKFEIYMYVEILRTLSVTYWG